MTEKSDLGMADGVRTIWPSLPSRRDLETYFSMRPGCEYLWCLYANQPHAERVEGWSGVELRTTSGTRPLPRFRIADRDVVLLSRGTPIPGASPNSCGIPLCIDPELEKALGLAAPELPKLPAVPPTAGPKQKTAAA